MSSQTRVAIVTGAAQGIGRAIALRLASDGIDVAFNDVPSKSDTLNEVVQEVRQMGRRALAVMGDVSRESDVREMVEKVVEELGGLDIMVANAGIGHKAGPIADADMEQWDRVFAVNIRGVALCYKYAAKQMIKQDRGGRILGTCSLAGKQGLANMGAYTMSKFAVRGLTQSTAQELGQYGITVNSYSPGMIKTALSLHEDDEKYGGPCGRAKHLLNIPNAKVGDPVDIASIVSYLVSAEAHFITGQTVIVDGGIIFD